MTSSQATLSWIRSEVPSILVGPTLPDEQKLVLHVAPFQYQHVAIMGQRRDGRHDEHCVAHWAMTLHFLVVARYSSDFPGPVAVP
eukprot:CAMPEP_0172768108 /NCGR_PEP_ID=MMETSP1074-20121228/184141_1 /TAXON_ID=2916 /ORGANISM="Ceratium fusus, Strain PA161109" /LENGTH=84 /DNA_ID=CAMNT_0013603455 /DNA_START=111 /DNA_END=365 /DNA_ORIENTATION=-